MLRGKVINNPRRLVGGTVVHNKPCQRKNALAQYGLDRLADVVRLVLRGREQNVLVLHESRGFRKPSGWDRGP